MIQLLIVLVIFGAVLFIVQHLPIDATVKLIIKVVAIVAAVVWLLRNYAQGML